MKRFLLTTAAAMTLAFATPSVAQVDDGLFTGNCWDVVQANIPTFNDMGVYGQGICWKHCQLDGQVKTYWKIPQPQMVGCGYYRIVGLGLYDANTFQPIWNPSNWTMIYTRTWVESSPNTDFQVWRFLINAEVTPSASQMANPDQCLIPKCTFNGNPQPIHYSGYIDYALDLNTNQWSVALGVQHACDRMTHGNLAKYQQGGHPERSFALVAPSDFIPDETIPAAGGDILTEAMRMYRFANWPNCESEQAVRGYLDPQGTSCPCSGGPGQFKEYEHKSESRCGSFTYTWNPHPFSWGGPGGTQMSAGYFNNNTYPGTETLHFVWEPQLYYDRFTNNTTKELFVGVATQKGWDAKLFQNIGVYAYNFLDLQNVYTGPQTLTQIAGLFYSDKLLYYNTY